MGRSGPRRSVAHVYPRDPTVSGHRCPETVCPRRSRGSAGSRRSTLKEAGYGDGGALVVAPNTVYQHTNRQHQAAQQVSDCGVRSVIRKQSEKRKKAVCSVFWGRYKSRDVVGERCLNYSADGVGIPGFPCSGAHASPHSIAGAGASVVVIGCRAYRGGPSWGGQGASDSRCSKLL